MRTNEINVDVLRKLALLSPNIVKHFVRSSARLYGKIALREQLENPPSDAIFTKSNGKSESLNLDRLLTDKEILQEQIASLAQECGQIIMRLNVIAAKNKLPSVLKEVNSWGLVQIIDAIVCYVEKLVAQSDYGTYLFEQPKSAKKGI